MAASTYSPEAHLVSSRRESSPRPRNTERRRPRLLRASVTEPYITTSNATKGVMTTPNTTRRATDLLNRVAVTNGTTSPASTRSSMLEADRREYQFRYSEAARSPNSACYFSFPSFDTWEEERREEDEKTERAS
ncbi:hypothetical protein F5Y15DRAFT_416332 [Xylariaceae sp. FL0016]|nr:hypothetical protein F5Y15DRAFT_416332 [Xylariaceae sp. FL0016]